MTTAQKTRWFSWILNGDKMWITNGTLNGQDTGDVFFFGMYQDWTQNRRTLRNSLSPKDMMGFSLGQQIKDKFEQGPQHCRIGLPRRSCATNVVGEELTMTLTMMRNLEIERIGSLPWDWELLVVAR
jgi:alkylation response protein AidB-like acyl-CoA dehydrogenase